MDSDQRDGALADLVVIDLTQMLSGPYCTMLLADMGARVIKVEPPTGDPTRGLGPYHPDDTMREFGGYFQSINRNKRSVVANLKTAEGKKLVLELVAQADVLVENFRPGVAERLGLGYEVVTETNPRLVYAAIRGYGDPRTGESPYADWPAFDVTAQAAAGIANLTGGDPEMPTKVGPSIGDIVPALNCAFGIMAAVHAARRDGRGQFVDVAMFDAIMALCERAIYQYSYTGKIAKAEGNDHPLVRPFGLFPAADGFVSIAAPLTFWRRFCELIDLPELADDNRFAVPETRLQNADVLNEIVSCWTRQRTRSQIQETLGGEIPFAPVNTAADLYAEPHVKARNMLASVSQPGMDAKVAIAGPAVHMTRTPPTVRCRAPRLGEHTEEVLAEFGIAPTQPSSVSCS